MRTFEQHWEEIEENFDFERVYQVMKMLDWHWSSSEESEGIPSVARIKRRAKEICLEAFSNKFGNCSTGGFYASYGDGVLILGFHVDEWVTNQE